MSEFRAAPSRPSSALQVCPSAVLCPKQRTPLPGPASWGGLLGLEWVLVHLRTCAQGDRAQLLAS